MKKRVLTLLLAAGLLVVAGLTALTFSAAAQTQTVYVQLETGEVVPVTVDAPDGTSLTDIQLPGTTVSTPTTTTTTPTVSSPIPPPETAPSDGGTDTTTGGTSGPTSTGGSAQETTSSGE
jgi:hypothetical protein